MKNLIQKSWTKCIFGAVILIGFMAAFFSYSRVNISPEIAQSNSAAVLITTFRGMSQTQTLSFNFKLERSILYRTFGGIVVFKIS